MKSKTALLILLVLFSAFSYAQPIDSMTKVSGTIVYPNGVESSVTWYRVGGAFGPH